MSTAPLSHNTVVHLEHFRHPELSPVLSEVWQPAVKSGHGWTPELPDRKSWEVAMAIRALRSLGVLAPDAEVLGVGAGIEATLFVLTLHARRVFANDLYFEPGDWSHTALAGMLADPTQYWRGPFDPSRLVVQHMNAHELRHPDGSFDGVFSSSSIEHFGTFEQVSHAIDEIHRVLRPGGVFSLSTELRLAGPPPGLPGTLMFDAAELIELVVGDRDWELVGGSPDLHPSNATLDVIVPISEATNDVATKNPHWSTYPHLILAHGGLLWTSVHLALRKN